MSAWLSWIADHLWLVLVLALAACLVGAVGGVRSVLRSVKAQPRPWLRLAWGVITVLLCGIGLVFAGLGAIEVLPRSFAQQRLIGRAAPELAYQRVADGGAAGLADHAGRVVLVNLWATWCPPCREEMPDLNRLQVAFQDRGLTVLQISDEPRETLSAYIAEHPMVTEHGYVGEFPWPAFGRPTTYVIDRQGKVQRAITRMASYEQFEELVRPYL